MSVRLARCRLVSTAFIAIAIATAVLLFCRGGAVAAEAVPERGRYIVERVAMCAECHTPRDKAGKLRESEYLRGAPIPVKEPPYPNTKWAVKAPNIAGLPGYSTEDGVRLLTQGINRNGARPNPPMPQFRLTREDANAVVAYLKSIQ